MEYVPEDMEKRRLAALEKFALNHPNHPQVNRTRLAESEEEGGEARERSWYHWLREQQLQPARKGKRPQCGKKPGGTKGSSNKWDTATSLELLAESKRFQDNLAGLNIRGIRVTSESRWATIAQNLPNRCGLEPAKYARSCKVHFMNMCRVYRAQGKNSKGEDALDPQVRRALEEYFQLGDVNVPRRPPLKRPEVQTSVKSVGNFVFDPIATNVKRSNHEDKSPAMAEAEKIALEKHSKRRPDPKGIENPQGVEKIRMKNQGGEAHQDPHEHEELGNSHQRVSPTMDTGAILRGWNIASTLQLLEAVRKVGPKVVNRWEAIASQLPNHSKLDRHEYVRSCKEQYRALLRVYTRENMQLYLGHKPLVDEVHAQLEKWLLLQSTTSKADHLTRKESPCVERRDTGLERVGVKPASNPCVIKQNEEGKGIPKARGGSPKKNKAGFMNRGSGMKNGNNLEPPTRTKEFAGAEDRNKNSKFLKGDGKGIYKTYIDRIVGTSTSKAGTLKSSGFNQHVDIDKRGPKDHDVQGEHNQKVLKKRTSKPVLCDESLQIKAKLKQRQQADEKERGLSKPFTHRILPDQARNNDSNSSNTESDIHLEDSSRGKEIHSTMIRKQSVSVEVKEKTKTNIFSSGPESNKLLHADKQEIVMNPAVGRVDNCLGLDRRLKPPLCTKVRLDSDQDDRSYDESMHLNEDDSASEEDESKRKRKIRSLIMNRMLKRRAERNKADYNRIG